MKKEKNNPIIFIIIVVIIGLLIVATCLWYSNKKSYETDKVEGLDKLGKITAVSRESGSGTRTEFNSILGIKAAVYHAYKENTRTEFNSILGIKEEMQGSDLNEVKSTNEVLRLVSQNESAIGYCSAGSVNDGGKYKSLKVNGTGISDKNGRYPLSRPFFLAWIGKLNDVEQDFLTYVKSKGQRIVGEYYTCVSSVSSFLSTKPEGNITITGSSSMAPLLRQLAAEYMTLNNKANIIVISSDTDNGINETLKSSSDMAMCSRELVDYEKELLEFEVIARDQIAVVVNSRNPLKNITTDHLKDIYTNQITDWGSLYE